MDALSRAVTQPAANALQRGKPSPLGAHFDGRGVNFAVHVGAAQQVELCLFDDTGGREIVRHDLLAHSGDVWHGYLPDAKPGLVYGYRVHGPWRPDLGLLFNPAKLLLDPYTREVVGKPVWDDALFGADRHFPLHRDARDSAAVAPKARVVQDNFNWGDDQAPYTPLADTVLLEVHVKGFSRQNGQLPEELRGTYAGLGHPASIAHLRRLGVTAVCLLPVFHALDEERLSRLGLCNYWGYNTLAFFAPDPRLASAPGGTALRDEFRSMVRALHAAGVEVVLDVVFNHTAESDGSGPTLGFRGLDNAGYYRRVQAHPAQFENHSGCGNTLDIRRPHVLRLVMDSLRYWVQEMHVDGFRFDLAPVLGRTDHGFDANSAFFAALAQDPVLSAVKHIAEPWDVGPGGYQLGAFPRGWLEWNDQFRDTMRKFWLGSATRGEFALRLCGSSDIYQARKRLPAESVNYVVSHDGFTLRDLVSYQQRHNHANGEDNRDGHDHNHSNNCGVEGPSDEPRVNALRSRLQRTLLACTVLAQGTPMLCAGDELGHSQGGNNNPYNQDNATTWIDWSRADQDLITFTARLLALRRRAMPFSNHWYSGLTDPLGLHDLAWLEPDGSPLQGEAWRDNQSRALACIIGQPGRARAPLLLLVNAASQPCRFMLPSGVWQGLLDTAEAQGNTRWHGQGEVLIEVAGNSLQLLGAAGAGVT